MSEKDKKYNSDNDKNVCAKENTRPEFRPINLGEEAGMPRFAPIDFSGLSLPDFENMDPARFGFARSEDVDMARVSKQLAGLMGRTPADNGLSYEDIAYGYDPQMFEDMNRREKAYKEGLDSFMKNPLSQGLSDRRLAGISLGLIGGEQMGYYRDSLATGAEPEEIKEELESYYDITDSSSATEALGWLADYGHREYFEAIKDLFDGTEDEVDFSLLSEEEADTAKMFIDNLKSALPTLADEGFVKEETDLQNADITAWDMARLVNAARLCFDMGYISENESWDYINFAKTQCENIYSDWAGFAAGYVIGRAMAEGAGEALPGTVYMAAELLADKNSPWNKLDFNA